MMLQINRMKSVSQCQGEMQISDKSRLLSALMRRTYQRNSLEHCFPASKVIQQTLQNKKSRLNRQIKEVEMDCQDEIMQSYSKNGRQEIRELTQYYKYYTQTSILHLPSFFTIMHQHRQQQKAYYYNKFKALLDLSSSTQNPSTELEREEGVIAPSFLILQHLNLTSGSNEESLLIQKLKNKLQRGFGPNHYHTLQEIDKQYIFAKKIQIVFSPIQKSEKASQKCIRVGTERTKSLKKRNQKKRKNSCDTQLFTQLISESLCKLKRKKNSSMTSLASLGKGTPLTRESSLKCTRTLFNPISNSQNQVKSKILGVKERIRRQKQQLLKKTETKQRKAAVERASRRPRH